MDFKALKFLLVFCSALATAIDARALIPPEIPQKRGYEVYSPFEFQAPSGDYYGADVITTEGPACLGYSIIFDRRQTGSPSTTPPVFANLPAYRNVLRTQAGLMFAASHANTGVYYVEAYEGTPSGAQAAQNAAEAYIAAGYGSRDEIKTGTVGGGYNGVKVTAAWIQRTLAAAKNLGLNPRHDIVVQLGCNSYPANLAFVNVNGLTRNYAGLNDLCPIGTDPTYYHQISSAIFNTMAGIKADNVGAYSNAKFITGVGIAQGLFGSSTPNLRSQKDFAMPIADLMRLYNSPRVVLEEVRQDVNRDGGYATQLYNYFPYQTYPYGSGTQDYPGSASLSGQISASSAPIRVTLRFSEPMDISAWGGFVRLRFSDNATQNLSGSWSTTVLSNDTWIGTISPSPFPDGQVTVEVRARKALCGSGLDTSNQELDTTGSGSSTAGTVQAQAIFRVSTGGPSGGNSNGNGTALSTAPMTNDNCLVSSATSPAGMQSISISGPSFGPVTTTFSCPTAAVVGPFCALSSGTYTITDTDCAEVENPAPNQVTVTTGAPFASITAVSPSTTKFSSFQPSAAQLAADSSVLTIKSDPGVTNFGGSQATDWQWVCKELLASASGSSSGCQFTCLAGLCYIQYEFIGSGLVPTSFSVTNSTTVDAQFGLGVNYYSVSPLLGEANVHFTQTESTLTPNASLIGTISVSGANQPRPAGSADGIANSTPTISHITVATGTCTPADTILQQLVAQLLASVLPNHNPYCWQGSEVVFTSPVPMSFSFQGPSGVTIDTATLGIYGYDLSSGTWTRGMATSQSISISSTGFIVASGSFTRTGTYGVYFQGQDSSAPVTTFAIQGSTFNFDGALFVSTDAFVVLTATDPVVNGFASTVASVTYRVDPSSGSPFYIYSSSIPLPFGTHVFEYRSLDYAGNTEAVKTATFTVTAGTAFRTSNTAQVPGVLLNGFLGSGAKLEIESQAQNTLTLLISSVNREGMVSVDNIGEVGIGVTPQANLNIGSGAIGLQLRSGNSTSSVTSNQIAFGYNGDYSMRHLLRTEHSTSTDGNKMDFLVWNTGAASTTTVASLNVLSLQGIKAASGGSFHVQPVGEPDAEVEVSNGLSTGGGTMQRLQVVAPSSRRFKTDIKDLSEQDENRALSDVAGLKHAKFRYKTRQKNGRLIEDPAQPLRTGLIYEEAPESIRDGAEALSTTERLVNVEMALKAAMRRLEELQARHDKLKARRKP